MARKKVSSEADLMEAVQNLIKGAEKEPDNVKKWGLDLATLKTLFNEFLELNTKHKELTAQKQLTAKSQTSKRKELKKEVSGWVSVIEGKVGKDSDKLNVYGITPRKKPVGRKGKNQSEKETANGNKNKDEDK